MRRLVLAGGGHAHVAVLDSFARRPPADVEITLVSPFPRQVYSGMLPGWIAGHYALDECVIPLEPLARRAGSRFVLAHVARIDLEGRIAYTEAAEPIPFDILSLDTGPVTDRNAIPGLAQHAIPLRPIESLIVEWQRLLAHFAEAPGTQTLTVIGGGAGGVELALAIAYAAATAPLALRVQLVTGRPGLVPSFSDAVRARLRRAIDARGVRLIEDDAIEIGRHTVLLGEGGELTSDATVVALGAAAAPWLAASGLATDDAGFVAVNEYLQSISHPFVFAAGDCATMIGAPRPKSGVYAVRAGPPLARNLRAALAGRPLARYTPQTRALYLLSTGAKHAVASWGPFSAAGAWVWRWKDRIDRRFVARYAPSP
jgi:selenide,water dikinase